MKGAARALVIVALASVGATAQGADVSIQIVNPDERTTIRVFLDRKLIYEGMPARSSDSNNPILPTLVGTFSLDVGKRHSLAADISSTHTKAQLEWTPEHDPSPWIVIRYYAGRSESHEPAFFAFSLQRVAYKLK